MKDLGSKYVPKYSLKELRNHATYLAPDMRRRLEKKEYRNRETALSVKPNLGKPHHSNALRTTRTTGRPFQNRKNHSRRNGNHLKQK